MACASLENINMLVEFRTVLQRNSVVHQIFENPSLAPWNFASSFVGHEVTWLCGKERLPLKDIDAMEQSGEYLNMMLWTITISRRIFS